MEAMNQAFQEIADEYASAEVFNTWMPPDGTYTVLLSDFHDGITEPPNRFGWARLTGTIVDDTNPEVSGKEFTVGYYTTKAPGVMKGDVAVLNGSKLNDVCASFGVLASSVGKVVIVEVFTRLNRKTNQSFTNCRIQSVVEETPAAPTAP